MSIVDLLTDLTHHRVQVRIEGNQLNIRAPKGVLTVEQRYTLSRNKAKLITLVQDSTTEPVTVYPLSEGQKALWFLYGMAPQSAAYNIMVALRIRSKLSIPVLRHAFEALFHRHSCLRTTYAELDGEPVQLVHDHMEVEFNAVDASTWGWNELEKRMGDEAGRPFNLVRGPVMRINLYAPSTREHVLLLTVHHIAFDLWSMDVLIGELRKLYVAKMSGGETSLPDTMQYSNYVRWQIETLRSPKKEQLWAYWEKQLRGSSQVLDLPSDRPRPSVQAYKGASYDCVLDVSLTSRSKALAQEEGATLYVVFLAAFQALLNRYTDQEDILVGSPMAGRSCAEFGATIGYFVNPLVLRADFSGNPTFRTFLRQVRRTVLAALEHADFPFPLLVERLEPTRDPSRSPLFQVAFVWDRSQLPKSADATLVGADDNMLNVEYITGGQRGAEFDLVMTVIERNDLLSVLWRYNTDLFEVATISRLAEHFEVLLEGIVTNPDASVSELPLLTDTERVRLLVEWNDTRMEYPHNMCVHQLFEAQVARVDDAVAVVYEREKITYKELNRRANQLAHHLKALGVGPETLVCVCVMRCVEMVVGLLGILKAGGAYVPLDPTYPKDRLAFMLEDTHAPLLLTQKKLLGVLPEWDIKTVYLDADWPEISQRSSETPVNAATAENLAYVIYTSGSTGQPKGVEIEHKGLVNLVTWHVQAYGVTNRDRATQVAALAFDASVWELWPSLCAGASIYLADEEVLVSPSQLLKWLAEKKVTLCFLPTPLAEAVLREAMPKGLVLRYLLTGGDKLHQVRQKGAVFQVINHYGPTENTVVTTAASVAAGEEGGVLPPIGRPISNTQLFVLDRHLNPVPVGVPGELYVSGVGLARGYLNRPDLTQERFVRSPFSSEAGARMYRTGDLVRYRPDGNLEFLRRMDHQVKIRGYRIELGEIEAVLGRQPGVETAVVVARQDRPGEKRLVAYAVVADGHSLGIEDLRNAMQDRLPGYMVPSVIMLQDELPLTANGKVDRDALPIPDTKDQPREKYLPPRDDLEAYIVEIWRTLLGIEKVGVSDNFFDLGGHSLLLGQVHARLVEKLHREIPMADLFQYPTVESLARHFGGELHEPVLAEQARNRVKRQREALNQKKGII